MRRQDKNILLSLSVKNFLNNCVSISLLLILLFCYTLLATTDNFLDSLLILPSPAPPPALCTAPLAFTLGK